MRVATTQEPGYVRDIDTTPQCRQPSASSPLNAPPTAEYAIGVEYFMPTGRPTTMLQTFTPECAWLPIPNHYLIGKHELPVVATAPQPWLFC